jgi:hypothetical protein
MDSFIFSFSWTGFAGFIGFFSLFPDETKNTQSPAAK